MCSIIYRVPPSESKALPEAKPVKVPDLCGLTVDEARRAARNRGLMLRLVGEGPIYC